MNSFRVWIRPLGNSCRVRVDGIDNAHWLLSRLSRQFVFKTGKPVREDPDSNFCSFLVSYTPPLTPGQFEEILASIPPVELMLDPEQASPEASGRREHHA